MPDSQGIGAAGSGGRMGLRIAHVTATFPPYRGGTGNVCYHNARELARLGHEVHVFTAAAPGSPAEELLDGIRVRRLRTLARVGNAPVLPGLPGALRGFDIVHLHYPFFGGESAAFGAVRGRQILVITYHQDVLLDGPLGLAAWALTNTVGRLALRAADRILFTSLDYAGASRIRPLLRGREAQIGELPNGVDVGRFHPKLDASSLRARLGIGAQERVALLVGGLDRAHYFKGVSVFLEALARLDPSIRGVIVGDGDLRTSYEARSAALGLDGRVTFAGRVSDEELPGYYRMAEMAVLPSTTMGEAFGLVLVEAMACGRPAVASSLPGVRTVVDDGRDGLLVPPGQPEALAAAIGTLAEDDALREQLGARGRAKVVARYAWEQLGVRLETLYRGLCADAPAARELPVGGEQ